MSAPVRTTQRGTDRPRIMLAMDWLDYDLNHGIARYARAAGWIISDLIVHTGHPSSGWSGDGAIVMLNDASSRLVPFVQMLKCPVVDVSNEVQAVHVPRLLVDDFGIGVTAAQHLLACGLHHFAFVRFTNGRAEADRMAGFRDAVLSAGRRFSEVDVRSLGPIGGDYDRIASIVGEQLLRLEKPLGVMCHHDRESMIVMYGCEWAGLNVPKDVAVVGSHNDPLVCELGPVSLSSVDVRTRDQGYQAAKLLDELMNGAMPPSEPIRISAGPVIPRRSSEVLAATRPELSRALHYIATHYRESISVDEVVRQARTTRRKLYHLFDRYLGRPIHSEVLRRRLEHARRLLVTTDDKLYSIARASGFLDAQHLTRAFTRELGIAPSPYRERQTGAAGTVLRDDATPLESKISKRPKRS